MYLTLSGESLPSSLYLYNQCFITVYAFSIDNLDLGTTTTANKMRISETIQ